MAFSVKSFIESRSAKKSGVSKKSAEEKRVEARHHWALETLEERYVEIKPPPQEFLPKGSIDSLAKAFGLAETSTRSLAAIASAKDVTLSFLQQLGSSENSQFASSFTISGGGITWLHVESKHTKAKFAFAKTTGKVKIVKFDSAFQLDKTNYKVSFANMGGRIEPSLEAFKESYVIASEIITENVAIPKKISVSGFEKTGIFTAYAEASFMMGEKTIKLPLNTGTFAKLYEFYSKDRGGRL